MAHVFISYSKKNRAYARQLADHLVAEGFDVWIDDRIDYGRSWERVIFNAIDQCAAFLVIMTPESYASEWVLRECQYADKRAKPVFPLLLDGEEFPRYGPTQYVDVRGGHLPPPEFTEDLARVAPQHRERGSDITGSFPAAKVNRSDAGVDRLRVSRWPLALGASGAALLIVVVAVAALRPQPGPGNAVTETPTLEVVELMAPILTLQALNVTPNDTATRRATATAAPSDTSVSVAAVTGGGAEITFISDRGGAPALYRMPASGGDATLLLEDETVESMAWAPDGTKYVYTAGPITNQELYLVDPVGAEPRNLTNAPSSSEYDAAWSPDGTRIAFVSDRDGEPQLYMMDADGSNVVRLSDGTSQDFAPSWSPDGRFLVYATFQDGSEKEALAVMNLDEGISHILLADEFANTQPSWSPDGERIAFMSDSETSNFDIMVMNIDGTGRINLTANDYTVYEGFPEWSPDGTQIAYWGNAHGDHEIYVISPEGGPPVRLTNDPANDHAPVWRPG